MTDYFFRQGEQGKQGKQGEKKTQIEKEKGVIKEGDRRINSQQSVIRGQSRSRATLSSFVLKGAAPQTSST